MHAVQTPDVLTAASDTPSSSGPRRHSLSRSVSSAADVRVYDSQITLRDSSDNPIPVSANREIVESEKSNADAQVPHDPARSIKSKTSSGWLGPIWTWARSEASPSGVAGAGPDAGGSTGAEAIPRTEAEIIKEEALRSSRPPTHDEAPYANQALPDNPVPQTTSLNPIVAHAPTKSWMDLFSSRNNLAAKRVTNGGVEIHDSGMEVMEIPDHPDETPAASKKPLIKVVGDNSDRKDGPLPPDDRGRSNSAKDASEGAASPLSNSDTVKKRVNAKKSAPPSPSNRSVTSRTASPAGGSKKERKQNFVLPSFGDTFYTLPRVMPLSTSQPPLQPLKPHKSPSQRSTLTRRAAAGLTKKTMNFVSSWLGPTYTLPHAQFNEQATEGHPPSDEMMQYLEERRERIARTWLGRPLGSQASSTLSSPGSWLDSANAESLLSTHAGSRLAVVPGSGSEHAVPAKSMLGVTSQTVPVGRIAYKGHHHLNSGHFNPASATSVAKNIGKDLPRIWDALEDSPGGLGDLAHAKRIVVIGVHGWFPGR